MALLYQLAMERLNPWVGRVRHEAPALQRMVLPTKQQCPFHEQEVTMGWESCDDTFVALVHLSLVLWGICYICL